MTPWLLGGALGCMFVSVSATNQLGSILSQQTQDIDSMLDQCWASVVDLAQHWFNITCLVFAGLDHVANSANPSFSGTVCSNRPAPVAETGFSHRLTAYKIVGHFFGLSYREISGSNQVKNSFLESVAFQFHARMLSS